MSFKNFFLRLCVPCAFGMIFSAEILAAGCSMGLDGCVATMVEKLQTRGWVGVELDKEEGTWNLVVQRVIPESPAARAGLQTGDVLLAINGIPYAKENDVALRAIYDQMLIGKTIEYRLRREGRQLRLQVHLAPIPERVKAQWIGQHILSLHASGELPAP